MVVVAYGFRFHLKKVSKKTAMGREGCVWACSWCDEGKWVNQAVSREDFLGGDFGELRFRDDFLDFGLVERSNILERHGAGAANEGASEDSGLLGRKLPCEESDGQRRNCRVVGLHVRVRVRIRLRKSKGPRRS